MEKSAKPDKLDGENGDPDTCTLIFLFLSFLFVANLSTCFLVWMIRERIVRLGNLLPIDSFAPLVFVILLNAYVDSS